MKILIAYDGSTCADAALDDMPRAGLPRQAEALVVSISEILVPATPSEEDGPLFPEQPPAEVQSARARAEQELQETQALATQARIRVQEKFPEWSVDVRVTAAAPAWGVLEVADEWNPDLIIVGTHGRSALGRLILGSVSQKVLAEARCSVRVARSHRVVDDSPVRIVIGFDGSADAEAAVYAVAARSWPAHSAVHVVGVLDSTPIIPPPPLDSTLPVVSVELYEEQKEHLESALEKAVQEIQATGLQVSPVLRVGDPERELLDEATEWGADSIFVGARGHAFMERVLVGSVSSGLAAYAHCSVEVVRPS